MKREDIRKALEAVYPLANEEIVKASREVLEAVDRDDELDASEAYSQVLHATFTGPDLAVIALTFQYEYPDDERGAAAVSMGLAGCGPFTPSERDRIHRASHVHDFER